jgi:hypothetical protein
MPEQTTLPRWAVLLIELQEEIEEERRRRGKKGGAKE